MKRLWTAVFAVGFLIGLGGSFSVQAGEIDALHLINLLKQKGVLTQEEAEGLMNEARKQAKAEKEELKADKKKINSWLGMNLTTDIFTSKDANDVGQGLEVRQKYAMAGRSISPSSAGSTSGSP